MARPKDPSLSGKTERIDTRVSPATREALQRAAEEAGWSLSREIEDRLARTLTDDGADGDKRQPQTESLLWALRLVIERVEASTDEPWWKDAFTRDEVANGLCRLVRILGPDVEGACSPAWIGEGLGNFCAEATIRAMEAKFADNDGGKMLEKIYSAERVAARALKGLIRHPYPERKDSDQ